MGYQALLFCPDEKTARTVTQVLNELEFAVESCIEPFAAVKKLMGQHFDAVVVDCDNEQNATLLFKSARNSTSNQTSLAVAVVEGQAGVAKAFRIGANLVLTKPINIEQAKGTLRVARGLLRKSEPGKAPAAAPVPPVAAAPVPPKPAPLKPISAVKPAAPFIPSPVVAAPPVEIPPAPPAPSAWPAVATTSSASSEKDAEILELDIEEPTAKPVATPSIPAPPIARAEQTPAPAAIAPPKPAFTTSSPLATSGAASAPAPARKIEEAPIAAKPQEPATAAAFIEKPAEAPTDSHSIAGSTPSFTFGGANVEAESKGGNKKILFGAVAAVVIAAVAYVGWAQFSGHSSAPATSQVATPSSTVTQSAKPASVPAAPTKPVAPSPAPSAPTVNQASTNAADDDSESAPQEITLHSTPSSPKPSTSASSASAKAPVTEPTAPAPMVVKGGKVPAAQSKASAADAPAPSLIGMATPDAAVPPPNFVASSGSSFKPVLQALTVSQGVSQGLLIKKVSPSYPPAALRMRTEGTVELLATVSKDGAITHIKIISGDSQLAKAAAEAVKQWKYRPYTLNGEPVEIQTQVTVNFKLPQ